MALKYATKNGNWSDPTVWNGGTLPVGQDVVLANNYTVTIDQDVDLSAGATTVTAGSFVVGQRYRIATLGNTSFTSIGAVRQLVGCEFIASGVGAGTGTATTVSHLGNYASTPAVAGGTFVASGTRVLTVSLLGANVNNSTPVLEIPVNTSVTLNGSVTASQLTGTAARVVGFTGNNASLTINGNVTGSATATTYNASAVPVYIGSGYSGTVLVVNGFAATAAVSTSGCIRTYSSSTITINGNLYQENTSTGVPVIDVQTAAATIVVNGHVYCGAAAGSVNGPAVYTSVANCTYTQTGNIYCGYGLGVMGASATVPVLIQLTGNIVPSAAATTDCYGIRAATATGSYITGNVESGASGGIYHQGGPLKITGTLTKGLASGVLVTMSGSAGYPAVDLDLSDASVVYAAGTPAGRVFDGTSGTQGLTLILPGITQKGSGEFLYYGGVGTLSLTVNGDIVTQGTIAAVKVANAACVVQLVVNGSLLATNDTAVELTTSSALSTVLITGNVTGGGASTSKYGLSAYLGTVTINGDVIGGAVTTGNYGVYANDASSADLTISILGDVSPGAAGAPGLHIMGIRSGSKVTVHGDIYASSSAAGVSGSTTGVSPLVVRGHVYDHSSGMQAVQYREVLYEDTAVMHKFNSAGEEVMFHAGSVWAEGLPEPDDVRAGITYGAGSYTGTCAVPAPGSVAFGVPVDDTYGTATLSSEQLGAMLAVMLSD